MKKVTFFLTIAVVLSVTSAFAADFEFLIGKWNLTITGKLFGEPFKGNPVWTFTEASKDSASGINHNNDTILATWNNTRGQYKVSSPGSTMYFYFSLIGNNKIVGEVEGPNITDMTLEGIKNVPTDIDGGYMAASGLWIKAVINTEDKGPINGVFFKGDEQKTARGDTVVWGYFYANPEDVIWGQKANPDLYVKIWFDVTGRIDVNFFHVSVPVIDVYSAYPYENSHDQHGIATMDNRYVRHEYTR